MLKDVLVGFAAVACSSNFQVANADAAPPPKGTYVLKRSTPGKYYDKHGNTPPSCGKDVAKMIAHPLVTIRYADRIHVNGMEWKPASVQTSMFSATSPRSTRELKISIVVHLNKDNVSATILALGLEDISDVVCADTTSYLGTYSSN